MTKESMSKVKIDRTFALACLMVFLTVSTAARYWQTGAQVSGVDTLKYWSWFWLVEAGLWTMLAIVETGVLVFIMTTRYENNAQFAFMVTCEFIIVVLVGCTQTPLLVATTQGLFIKDILSLELLWVYQFCNAMYVPISIISVAGSWHIDNGGYLLETDNDKSHIAKNHNVMTFKQPKRKVVTNVNVNTQQLASNHNDMTLLAIQKDDSHITSDSHNSQSELNLQGYEKNKENHNIQVYSVDKNQNDKTLGEYLAELNLTQREFATAAGVDQSYVSKYKRSSQLPQRLQNTLNDFLTQNFNS